MTVLLSHCLLAIPTDWGGLPFRAAIIRGVLSLGVGGLPIFRGHCAGGRFLRCVRALIGRCADRFRPISARFSIGADGQGQTKAKPDDKNHE